MGFIGRFLGGSAQKNSLGFLGVPGCLNPGKMSSNPLMIGYESKPTHRVIH